MHDGRFATLEEVVEHYNSSVNKRQNLDHRLLAPDGASLRRINLSNDEKPPWWPYLISSSVSI